MLTHLKPALAAVAGLLVAGAAFAAPPTPVYLAKAGASDLYEKTSSQIVLGSTQNRDVRRFANMMVMDHGKSTMMVKSAAMRAGLHPKPPMLDPMQRRMIADLRHAQGRDRDRLYVDQQKQAHQMALDLQQQYAATGNVPSLRRAAGNIVPVVQHHIEMLSGM